MKIHLHQGDLPNDINLGNIIAVDTETHGLHLIRDRLCLIQLSDGDGICHLVQFKAGEYNAPNLCRLLGDPKRLKLMQYARFDIAVIQNHLNISAMPVYCTKIASKLVRTYTDKHGLSSLCKELLDVDLSKQQQSSDWAADDLSDAQLKYAASDVLYLHRLKEKLDMMLIRENRMALAQSCFDFIPTRSQLDTMGWNDMDVFHH